MKTIFLYANIRTFDFTLGITRKVYSEIKSFRKCGYNVYYSGYLKDGVAIFDNQNKIIHQKKYSVNNSVIIHIIRRTMLMNLCISFLKDSNIPFEISYVRYHFFDKKYVQLLSALKSKSKTVVIEAHSAPKFPKKLSLMTYVGWKDKRWNNKAKLYVDLVASMSDEEKLWGINVVKIANGIDVDSIKIHDYKGEKDEINLIAVSFESAVHGYDRVLRGIRKYYDEGGKRSIHFHIVGSTMSSTRSMIKKLSLEDRCFAYGPLANSALDEIYNKANIGVGCLANHRIGSMYGSALKTKEYIAKGIPFIYGWKEKVLESFKYGLNFELCEEPVDMGQVIGFYDNLPKDGLPKEIRNHLGAGDTWDYQIKKVINAIEK